MSFRVSAPKNFLPTKSEFQSFVKENNQLSKQYTN